MIYAMFISCMASVSGVQECSVSYTEMSSVVSNNNECVQVASYLQDTAVSGVLLEYPTLHSTRKEVRCGTRKQIVAIATNEHKKLTEQGISTEEFEF